MVVSDLGLIQVTKLGDQKEVWLVMALNNINLLLQAKSSVTHL